MHLGVREAGFGLLTPMILSTLRLDGTMLMSKAVELLVASGVYAGGL